MKIINLKSRKTIAAMSFAAIAALGYGFSIQAAPGDIQISPSAEGTAVLGANGSTTVLGTFEPDLDLASSTSASLEASATSSVTAYYGLRVVSATSSPDVHWRITISHETNDLVAGDVAVREVGTYDADSGKVRASPATYTATETSGDLALNGDISGWSIAAGEDLTNIDEITFAQDAPTGTYTITRALVDESTGETFDAPFSFTIELEAPISSTPDTTAPTAPVIVFPIGPLSTSTNPITIGGTAEENSSIMIIGGSATSTATTTGAGNWSASVNLTASSTNTLMVTAMDASGNVSSSTSLTVTHASSTSGTTTPDTTAPAAPVITFPTVSPYSTSANLIFMTGTAEAGSSITVTGAASSSVATTTSAGNWAVLLSLTASSSNAFSVTATDEAGNTSSSTNMVIIQTADTGTTTPATSTPVITLSGDQNMTIFSCNGFTDPGATAVDSSGASITATSTGAGDIRNPGTYTITYTATDAAGNTATTTRTVVVRNCSAGGGGRGGGGGAPFTVITPSQSGNLPPGPPINTPPVQFIANPGGFIPPGQVLPGQVLGATAGVSFQFLSNLTVGSRGQDVIELQTRLTANGFYNGPITGYFGGMTKAAVMALQRANGFPATGYFGPMTRALLNS